MSFVIRLTACTVAMFGAFWPCCILANRFLVFRRSMKKVMMYISTVPNWTRKTPELVMFCQYIPTTVAFVH